MVLNKHEAIFVIVIMKSFDVTYKLNVDITSSAVITKTTSLYESPSAKINVMSSFADINVLPSVIVALKRYDTMITDDETTISNLEIFYTPLHVIDHGSVLFLIILQTLLYD